MTRQYDTRRDARGWTVFDRWTGETVMLGLCAQAGLSWLDADDLAERLNRRRLAGDRSILQ
ncbi:hypothetical protein ACO2Q0_05130 [Phenylobacterium sp. VNQ135]|uniref:hypothetical protein n=1 Tax=Phenylobacterium sp. VNQ135 TaxID=3400922 RepID=UPI003C058EAE